MSITEKIANKLTNLIYPKPIQNENHWTNKTGRKLGGIFDKFFAYRKVKVVLIILMIAILFLFIVPIKNNIVTLLILAVLLVLYYFCKKVNKK